MPSLSWSKGRDCGSTEEPNPLYCDVRSWAVETDSMRRYILYAGLAATLLALIAAGIIVLTVDRCRFDTLLVRLFPTPPLFVTFLGVSTLLIDDGTDAILIDGYFTRPQTSSGSSPVAPDD